MTDVEDLVKLALQAAERFETKKVMKDVDEVTIRENIERFILNGDRFICLKSLGANGEINGFAFLLRQESLYSNMTQVFSYIAIQPVSNASSILQARIVSQLMNAAESIASILGGGLINFSTIQRFDLGKNLQKKGYQLSEIKYIKEVA